MKLKNIVKTTSSLLLALMTVMGISMTAFAADSSVTFKDGKLTVFEPGSAYANSDMFDNFKGVMPGDTRSEEITVQNKSKDYDYIKVYMRAVLHDESGNPISEKVLNELRNDERREQTSEAAYMYDFLSQLYDAYINFDTEQHAVENYGMLGAPGLRVLLDDADAIEDELKRLWCALSKVKETA